MKNDKSSAFQCPSPVLLSSQCSVASRNNASPNMTELSYPFRKAILISEIRFDMWADNDTGSASAFNIGSFVYVKFSLGQHYLMRDPVPVWLLGTSMLRSEEQLVDEVIGTRQIISHYRWRLPEPLYVAAGQTLRPVFNRVTLNATRPPGNVNVQVSYAGRAVPPNYPAPRRIAIPYAAAFVTTLGNTYQQSNEFHLINPFKQPLLIQRLTGRVLSSAAAGSGILMEPAVTPRPGSGGGVAIQVDDSWGGKMVNDLTGPGDVFDVLRAAWTVDTVMPPKGTYNVRVWNMATTQQVHIGMVGTRQEIAP